MLYGGSQHNHDDFGNISIEQPVKQDYFISSEDGLSVGGAALGAGFADSLPINEFENGENGETALPEVTTSLLYLFIQKINYVYVLRFSLILISLRHLNSL